MTDKSDKNKLALEIISNETEANRKPVRAAKTAKARVKKPTPAD